MKELYRTVWELKQKDLIDMAVSRSMFVDQVPSRVALVIDSAAVGKIRREMASLNLQPGG